MIFCSHRVYYVNQKLKISQKKIRESDCDSFHTGWNLKEMHLIGSEIIATHI